MIPTLLFRFGVVPVVLIQVAGVALLTAVPWLGASPAESGPAERRTPRALAGLRLSVVSFITDMSDDRRGGRLEVTAKLFRGLGDMSRLRVLAALRDAPLRVGEVVARTGLSQPNASMHLQCLAECGLVTWARDGRFVHYEIADKAVVKLLDQGEELLRHIGPLIAACPRYRRPGLAARRRPRSKGRA